MSDTSESSLPSSTDSTLEPADTTSPPAPSLEDHIAALQAQLAAATAALAEQNAPAPPPPPAVPVTVTCPACGDVSDTPDGDAEYALKGISVCTKCHVRIVYGEVAPRCVLEPALIQNATGNYRVLCLRIQNGATKEDVFRLVLDAEHGCVVGKALIAMVQL